MTKISVIIPVYNAEKYLRQCLDSVISQTLNDIEIICVDDGSTDASLCILKKYAKNDSRLTAVTQKNQGAAAAKNIGLKMAMGEFVAFMDSDDMYPDDDVLKELYNSAKLNKVNICGGSLYRYANGKILANSDKFDKNEEVLYKDFQDNYGFTRFIYNRQFLKDNEITFPLYARYEDPPFFVRAMVAAGKFYAVTRSVYLYRTSHKTIYWTEAMLIDTLNGILDCLQLAETYKYSDLVKKILRYINSNYFVQIVFSFRHSHKCIQIIKHIVEKYEHSLHPLYKAYKNSESLLNMTKYEDLTAYLSQKHYTYKLFGFIPLLSIEEK